jgi:hypothetical protein
MAVKLWTTLVLPIRTVQSGHSNLDTPIWRDQNGLSELTRSARLQQLDSPYWTGRISLLVMVCSYWSVHIGLTNLPRTIAQNFHDSRTTTD